jgi:hypothetical protein
MGLRSCLGSRPWILRENVKNYAPACRGGDESTVKEIERFRKHAEWKLDGVRETANEDLQVSRSDTVLPTQKMIDCLAERIERAFTIRHSPWYRGCSTPRLWSAAATRLWQVHCEDRRIPLDPELFIASQPLTDSFVDPWLLLAHRDAGRRYRKQVRSIIRLLRAELRREISRAETQVREGKQLSAVLRAPDPHLSPLGRFIMAHRAGRLELAERFRSGAIEQHHCCPLYRAACRNFLAPEFYPIDDGIVESEVKEALKAPRRIALLN